MSRGVIFTKKFIVKLYIFLKPLFLWKTVVFGSLSGQGYKIEFPGDIIIYSLPITVQSFHFFE